MNSKNNGGPAFPLHETFTGGKFHEGHSGMSLRDYLAARASDEDINEIMHHKENCVYRSGLITSYKITRQEARYVHADAMLAAREENKNDNPNGEAHHG